MSRFLVLFLLIPYIGLCVDLTSSQLETLKSVRAKLSAVQDFRSANILTADNESLADPIITSYYLQAEKMVGHTVAIPEIDQLIATAPTTNPTSDNSANGFNTFLVVMIILAGFLTCLAASLLFGYYLFPLFAMLPQECYELFAYSCTALAMFAGYFFQPIKFWTVVLDPLWLAVPGALCFAGCVYLTYAWHWDKKGNAVYFGPGLCPFSVLVSGLCTIVWAGLAIFYHSVFPTANIPYFLAFISVIALESFLGFSVITAPGCVAMRWSSDDVVPRTTTASFFILSAYVLSQLLETHLPASLQLFSTGCLFMGAFVYYLGLLVMSSKWYSWQTNDSSGYFFMQIVTVVSGLSAFYLGTSYHIPILLGIGGTFFSLFLCEKYYEIPWEGIGVAWAMLGFAFAIYFLVGFAAQHPTYFLWTL